MEAPSIDRASMFIDALGAMGIPVKGSRILDLGAGFGSIALALARCGAEVTAIDAAEDRTQELARRASEGNLGLDVVTGNLLDPPARKEHFDLALLVGVVDYAGLWNSHDDVEYLQVKVLQHAFSALKPGGRVVLCTKNRWWPVFAFRDVHTRKPLLNVLPRSLAERVSRAIWGEPYRRYIHSPATWSRLLEKAGFVDPVIFTPYFSYQYPLLVVAEPSFSDIGRLIPEQAMSSADSKFMRGKFWRLKAGFIIGASKMGFRSSQSVVIEARK